VTSLLANPAVALKVAQYENASERLIEQAQKIADLEELLRKQNAELAEVQRQLTETRRLVEQYQDRERQRQLQLDAAAQAIQQAKA
jgi:chromosome segregation ATPase